jgi:hypothetical protein
MLKHGHLQKDVDLIFLNKGIYSIDEECKKEEAMI